MNQSEHFAVVAIPLSRPAIVDFLIPPQTKSRGVKVRLVGQRPTRQSAAAWIEGLHAKSAPTINDLLSIDDPHGHLMETTTDRLVPAESLAMPNFLTRDLGGWVANFFGPMGLPHPLPDDPLLNYLEILTDYGPKIRYLGADPALVQARLQEEMEGDVPSVIGALTRLNALRQKMTSRLPDHIEQIYTEIATGNYFAGTGSAPLPDFLLYDELTDQLVRLELRRRAALARGDRLEADTIRTWQQAHEEESGLRLILQGEYIVGRHRRSTIVIAPELGVVIKQPAPEPLHDIDLGAKVVQGRQENWPVTTNGGPLVTARGRVCLTIQENIVPRLNQVFKHNLRYSTLLGLTVEPFVVGKTVQDWVLEDHSRLTLDLYETIVLHQQVCETLKIDNNDWHAPNFVRRDNDGEIVHIDWGAARPLEADELTPEGILARINQVSNMAFSFKDPDLAAKLKSIHAALLADKARMENLRRRAQTIAQL